jgi:glutamate racemase
MNWHKTTYLVLCILTWIHPATADEVLDAVVTHAKTQPDALPTQVSADLPVGVFDSGIGGLTVLEAILGLDAFHNTTLQPGADGKPDFQNERFIYLGDQANMPYGNYSAVGRTDFLRELILRDALFLLKHRVKAIVIACNTATAYGLDDIRALVSQLGVPVVVVGVVEAGARGVAESLPRELGSVGVGVLATVGTCSSGTYVKNIQSQTGRMGKSPPAVCQQGSIGLAGAIEGDPQFISPQGKRLAPYGGPAITSATGYDPAGLIQAPDGTWQLNSVENYLRHDLTAMLDRYKQDKISVPMDRLVLGCTHFPLIKEELTATLAALRAQSAYKDLVAEQVQLIDPAELTARELFRALALAKSRRTAHSEQKHQFFISTPNPKAHGVVLDASGKLERQYQYSRLPGKPERDDTTVLPMTVEALPAPSRQLLQRHLPLVWRALAE